MRLMLGYLRHNLMSAMAYRAAFTMQVFGMMLNNTMLLVFWWLFFEQLRGLHGWELVDIIRLYGVVAFGFGAAGVVLGNSSQIARIIATGDLDYYLVLPANPLVHLLVSRSSLPALGDMAFGVIVYLAAAPDQWRHLALFLLLGLTTGIIFAAFRVIVGSLAFWLGSAQNLALQLNNAIITFSLYPVDIFPGLVRILLYTLIPAAFVGSVPAKLLRTFDWPKLTILIVFTAAITLAAWAVFRRGLRRYESGNLVTMRG